MEASFGVRSRSGYIVRVNYSKSITVTEFDIILSRKEDQISYNVLSPMMGGDMGSYTPDMLRGYLQPKPWFFSIWKRPVFSILMAPLITFEANYTAISLSNGNIVAMFEPTADLGGIPFKFNNCIYIFHRRPPDSLFCISYRGHPSEIRLHKNSLAYPKKHRWADMIQNPQHSVRQSNTTPDTYEFVRLRAGSFTQT
jgi:hypothetical protein